MLQPEPKPGDLIEIFRPFYRHWAIYVGDGYVIHLAPPSKDAWASTVLGLGGEGDGGAVGNRWPQHSPWFPTGGWFLGATRRQFGVGQWFSNYAPWNPRGSIEGLRWASQGAALLLWVYIPWFWINHVQLLRYGFLGSRLGYEPSFYSPASVSLSVNEAKNT